MNCSEEDALAEYEMAKKVAKKRLLKHSSSRERHFERNVNSNSGVATFLAETCVMSHQSLFMITDDSTVALEPPNIVIYEDYSIIDHHT